MRALETAVNDADDQVFAEFVQRLGLDSVRDYETVQLRAAEEESEARARFDAQIARLNHQSVFESVLNVNPIQIAKIDRLDQNQIRGRSTSRNS